MQILLSQPYLGRLALKRPSSLPCSLQLISPLPWRRPCPATTSPVRWTERRLTCRAHGAVKDKPKPGEKKGFVEEMRFVAMRLHTKDQAPKEGGQKAAEVPFQKWQPTREGYLRFLAESKAVYDMLEQIVADAPHPDYARFQNTGLERGAALTEDIAWFKSEYGLSPSELKDDGPGRTYARLLQQLAKDDPQAFICHFYNIYFAHTAGGRMIGSKVAGMLLDGKELAFYRYDTDFRQLLEGVKEQLNDVAASWTREQKDHCLEETEKSFSYSGGLLRTITA